MTLEVFDRFPGHSPGYNRLPDEVRRQIVEDVPRWSALVRKQAEHFGYPYVDTAHDFAQRPMEAESALTN